MVINLTSPETIKSIDLGVSTSKLGGVVDITRFTDLENFISFTGVQGNDIENFILPNPNVKLKKVWLSYNKLTGSANQYMPQNVVDFRIQNNLLNAPLSNLLTFNKLEVMRLDKNLNMGGGIPTLPGSIKEFFADNCSLTGPIPNLNNNTNLVKFICFSNNLTGQIPNLDLNIKLDKFICRSNNLTGSIPVINNPKLRFFYCHDNQLTGSIPNLDNLPEMAFYYCYLNDLTGPIPSLDNLPKLQHFKCFKNNITGTIPNLSNNNELRQLDIYENQITGSIPSLAIGPNYNLNNFKASKNQLTGTIPSLTLNKNLKQFECADNQLTDFTTSSLSAVTRFIAQNNQLTTAAVDKILQALANASTSPAGGIANLAGTNSSPTNGNSNSDKLVLEARGWTVTVTP